MLDAKQLDRDSATPLWSQLEDELRRRVDEGDFERRFPTDRELMDIYGVSRHTARHAIGQLGADGIVRRSRGIGTSLDRPTLRRSLGPLYSMRQLLEDTGKTQSNDVLALEVVRDAEIASRLELDSDAELVFLERLRLSAGVAFAIDRVWMPIAVAAPLLEVDFADRSLYDEFERSLGRRPNEGWERITVGVADARERDLLALEHEQAVFVLHRLGRYDEEPVEWRAAMVRADWFSLVADWSAGQRADLRWQLDRTQG